MKKEDLQITKAHVANRSFGVLSITLKQILQKNSIRKNDDIHSNPLINGEWS